MDLEENYKCSICLDTIEEPVYKLIKCQHTFHKSCLQQWFVKNNLKTQKKIERISENEALIEAARNYSSDDQKWPSSVLKSHAN